MKKQLTLLALTISFSMNAQISTNVTDPNGTHSSAMGHFTTANGYASTVMGARTTASDYASLVIGQHNLSGSSATSADSFSTAAPAFVIGNGTAYDTTSDAFKVLFNGDTTAAGSITATSFIGDGSQLTNLPDGILSPVTEGSNTGVRLSTAVADNHGDIGAGAVDLSYQPNTSTKGATGTYSTAMGSSTTASGLAATATGDQTTASGVGSTAMGGGTTASGNGSTAMGVGTKASDFASTVIGQYNSSGSTATNSVGSFSTAAPAFVIGNGTASDATSDAFKVLFNGETTAAGSITATSFIGDGSQLSNLPSASIAFTDLTSTPTTVDGYGITDAGTGILSPVTEGSNTGVRLSTSNADNHGDIGVGAIDLSFQSAASTTRGATGDYSTATGKNTIAKSSSSTAMGNGTTASGIYSTAMGFYTKGSGKSSTAMGSRTTASDFGSLVIGQYNLSGATVTDSANSFSTANTAFVIGNGTGTGDDASDGFKVLFNGDTTVGNDLTVNGDVVISSDSRLKANIISLGATLSKLLLIDGKSYTMKKDGKQKIGVLAQDIQKVFPELVSTDDNDMLAVNYQGLVPVLINALKEQDNKMKAQQKEIDRLKEQEKRLDRLEKLVDQLD